MIIRPEGSSQLLISQPHHAALAAHIMRRWRADGFPNSPRRAAILLAIEEHDNGWREVDAAPVLDVTTGRILDFISAPDSVRRGVWPRGVERLAAEPYAAALVAQHAMHVYGRYRTALEWRPFFAEMAAARDRHLQAAAPLTLHELLGDYFFLRMGDLVSLAFCNGWTDMQTDASGYVIRLEGACVTVKPDPFAGGEVSIEIAARELPSGPFGSVSEAQRAFSCARTVTVTGTVSGR